MSGRKPVRLFHLYAAYSDVFVLSGWNVILRGFVASPFPSFFRCWIFWAFLFSFSFLPEGNFFYWHPYPFLAAGSLYVCVCTALYDSLGPHTSTVVKVGHLIALIEEIFYWKMLTAQKEHRILPITWEWSHSLFIVNWTPVKYTWIVTNETRTQTSQT